MDQPQPRGDFYAPLTRYKQPGDNKPMFTGHLTKPGEKAQFPIALWAFEYTDRKTGERLVGYSGSINGIPENIPAMDQVRALMAEPTGVDVQVANLTLRPGQIVLFVNGFKDPAEPMDKGRPPLWGWVNPTDGTPPFKPGVWMRTFAESGKPYLSGRTERPLPGKTAVEMQDGMAEVAAERMAGEHLAPGGRGE